MTIKGKNKKRLHRSSSGNVKVPRNTTSTVGRKVPHSLKESLMAGMNGNAIISMGVKGTRRGNRRS